MDGGWGLKGSCFLDVQVFDFTRNKVRLQKPKKKQMSCVVFQTIREPKDVATRVFPDKNGGKFAKSAISKRGGGGEEGERERDGGEKGFGLS